MTVTTTQRNGVDVQKLMTLVEDVKREPWKGRLQFTVRSQWEGGFKARHTPTQYVVGNETRHHQPEHWVESDEPREVLGSDAGLSPAELVLSALASCLSVGYAANAAAKGIDIEELRLEINADGDLQGFMNLNDVRPGLTDVSVKVHVKSNATPEQLKELHDYVNSHSPIWDTISNPVKVRSELAG